MKHGMISESEVSSSSPVMRNLLKIAGSPTSEICAPSLSSSYTCDLSLSESHVDSALNMTKGLSEDLLFLLHEENQRCGVCAHV